MTLKEITDIYILCDGEIISCNINFDGEPFATLILKIREKLEKKMNYVLLQFQITGLSKCEIYEDFKTQYYSDITLIELENGEFYLSLDPYDNSNIPDERDNFIICGKTFSVKELQ